MNQISRNNYDSNKNETDNININNISNKNIFNFDGKSFDIYKNNDINNTFLNYENNTDYYCNIFGKDNINKYVSNNENKVLNESNYNHDNIQINKVNDINTVIGELNYHKESDIRNCSNNNVIMNY